MSLLLSKNPLDISCLPFILFVLISLKHKLQYVCEFFHNEAVSFVTKLPLFALTERKAEAICNKKHKNYRFMPDFKLTNGRICNATYVGKPEYPDVLSDFDLRVTKTQKFSTD
jgi:hypothetical protein